MIPSGEYTGHVHGWFGFLNGIWTGKVFEGETVVNKVLEGTVVEVEGNTVEIRYTSWLKDTIVPAGADQWNGTMQVFGCTLPFLRFTLTRT